MRLLLAALFAMAASAATPGCGPSCHPTERVIDAGIRDLTGPVRTFETSAPGGPYLPFEGGTLLHIRHGLGMRPQTVHVTLSFTERPLEAYQGGYSSSAGNQAITLRHDEEEIAIKNDSCANYFVRVVVIGIPSDEPSDAATEASAVGDASSG